MTTRHTSVALMLLALLAAAGALIGFGSLAHAQDRDTDHSRDDSVVRQDRSLYQRLNLNERLGKAFHSHQAVCDTSSGEDVHCDARVLTDDSGVPLAVSPNAAPPGLSPSTLNKAYNLPGIATTSRRVIAIVDAYDDPNIAADLGTYSATFGLPQLPQCAGAITASNVPCFKKVSQTGSSTLLPARNSGWALEIALDVETAHAMCQNCSILLVEANSASFGNLMSAVDRAVALGATVVSNSYGGNEFSGETAYDTHFNRPGVAFTVSSGDSGYGVEYPASSRYVTAVGGTTLLTNPDGSYNSELAWSGAGSGCSAFENKQPWQTDASCGSRMVADVAAVADPNTGAAVYDSYRYQNQAGWFQVGGTSLAAPIIASVYAISGNTSGAANSIPYGHIGALHDVASGSNGSCGVSYFCTSLLGFDGPTGLGTPNGFSAY